MNPGQEESLVAHLGPEGARGRAMRPLFAQAAEERLVLRRGTLVAAYGFDDVRLLSSSPALAMPRPVFPDSAREAAPSFVELFAQTLSFRDAEDHGRLRGLLLHHFTTRALSAVAPRIETLVAELLDDVAADGAVDLVEAVADPLPPRVIAALMGAPRESWAQLGTAGHAMLTRLAVTFQGAHAATGTPIDEAGFLELIDFLGHLLHSAELVPTSIGGSLRSAVRGGHMDDRDALGVLVLLYMTGMDTVSAAIANAVLTLVERPLAAARMRSDPALAASFVDEVLRLDPPLPYAIRSVREEVEVAGTRLRPGDQVVLCLAAANLDPRRHPDPLAFRVTGRQPTMAFGHGAHRCLGASLARMQISTVVAQISARGLRAPSQQPPEWRSLASIHAPRSLDVIIGARAERAAS